MSMMFLQPVLFEHFYPRRTYRPRRACGCGVPSVYEQHCGIPSFYGFRRAQPRPSSALPLMILKSLWQDEEANKTGKAEDIKETPKAGSKDIVVKPEKFETRFDVKGFNPDEINVRIEEDKFVAVHAKHEEKSENGCIYREYKRVIQLPEGTDSQKLMSTLSTDGVLTVRVPVMQAIGKEEGANKDIGVEVKEANHSMECGCSQLPADDVKVQDEASTQESAVVKDPDCEKVVESTSEMSSSTHQHREDMLQDEPAQSVLGEAEEKLSEKPTGV